jgi:hypothetical protein
LVGVTLYQILGVDYSDKKMLYYPELRRLYSVSLWEGESQCRRTEAKEQEV